MSTVVPLPRAALPSDATSLPSPLLATLLPSPPRRVHDPPYPNALSLSLSLGGVLCAGLPSQREFCSFWSVFIVVYSVHCMHRVNMPLCVCCVNVCVCVRACVCVKCVRVCEPLHHRRQSLPPSLPPPLPLYLCRMQFKAKMAAILTGPRLWWSGHGDPSMTTARTVLETIIMEAVTTIGKTTATRASISNGEVAAEVEAEVEAEGIMATAMIGTATTVLPRGIAMTTPLPGTTTAVTVVTKATAPLRVGPTTVRPRAAGVAAAVVSAAKCTLWDVGSSLYAHTLPRTMGCRLIAVHTLCHARRLSPLQLSLWHVLYMCVYVLLSL